MTADRDLSPPINPLRIDVRRGNPTDMDIAAVVGVIGSAYAEEAAAAAAVPEPEPAPSPWLVMRRGLRGPLRRELGWGRFGG